MASILDLLGQQLAGGGLSQMSRQLGTDHATTTMAVSAALPVLMAALARNASSEDGAASLHNALADHDGSIFDDLGGSLIGFQQGAGGGILDHVLGDNRGAVEQGLAQRTGLDSAQIASLLAMLAPIVMGALGKTQRSEGLDPLGMAGKLADEHQSIGHFSPDLMSMIGGLLGGIGGGGLGSMLGGS